MKAHRCSAASPAYVLGSLAAAVIALGACGGSVSSGDGNGASGGAQSTGTSGGGGGGSGGGDGALISMICPTGAPATGADCLGATSPGTLCEYGGEGAYLACTTLAVCGTDRKWIVSAPDASCSGIASKNEAACPSSYAALAAGAACPATLGGSCVYPEGVCECAHCGAPGGGGGGNEPAWSCAAWPTTAPACPSPRPRAGTVCTTNGQECDYARVCEAVSLGLPDLKCVAGFWQDQKKPAPPCAFPQCSK